MDYIYSPAFGRLFATSPGEFTSTAMMRSLETHDLTRKMCLDLSSWSYKREGHTPNDRMPSMPVRRSSCVIHKTRFSRLLLFYRALRTCYVLLLVCQTSGSYTARCPSLPLFVAKLCKVVTFIIQ